MEFPPPRNWTRNERRNMWEETLDDYEISYEEEMETMDRHYKTCTKAERDEYCKICLEY